MSASVTTTARHEIWRHACTPSRSTAAWMGVMDMTPRCHESASTTRVLITLSYLRFTSKAISEMASRMAGVLGWITVSDSETGDIRYIAAGVVLVDEGRVLVLRRPGKNEVRLPKGGVEPGESLQEAALRELQEESGYAGARVLADLGVQIVEFDHDGRHWVRTERYFLATLKDPVREAAGKGEVQFEPVWLDWAEALQSLTFEPEREWIRRARRAYERRSVSVPVLLVSGTVGVGKTAVAAEMSDILSSRKVPHAFIDRDALGHSWPPRGRFNEELAFQNLAAVWANFRAAGAERLIVACVVESQDDLRRFEAAVPGASIVLCRLTAPQKKREARLRGREVGSGLAWHLARTVELERILLDGGLEDFRVENDDRTLDAVAREVLERAGWLDATSASG